MSATLGKGAAGSVAKVVEITSSSPKSFEDAIPSGDGPAGGFDDVPGDGKPQAGPPEFAGPRLVDPLEPLDRKSFFARRGREGESTPSGRLFLVWKGPTPPRPAL